MTFLRRCCLPALLIISFAAYREESYDERLANIDRKDVNIFDGKRWIHKSRLRPEQLKKFTAKKEPELPPLRRCQVQRPGPSADEMTWDLSVPEVEKRYVKFITTIIGCMRGQDIFEMEGNWRTLIRPAHCFQAVNSRK